jgi:DNA-binding transcriptional MocR family regulator
MPYVVLQTVLDLVKERLDAPTARALAHAVSAAIGAGELLPGLRLPPIRTVAAELGLSPTTVSSAWSLLARSGAIKTDGRRGTIIAPAWTPGPARYRRALGAAGRVGPAGPALDLSTGVPDPGLLPDIRGALGRLGRLSRAPVTQTYLDEPVVPELAEVLLADWPFAAEALTITDGALDALDLLSTHLLRFGDRVAVEHPSFPPLLDLLEACGAQIIAVDVDADGARPDQLGHALAAGARVAILSPRAQNPTGASWSAGRAGDLAAVLSGHDALIIENDSAGAVASTPLISLGAWHPDRCVHIRSFSKSHGPDLRLAAVAGPASVVHPIVERRHLGQGWTSRLLQRLLLDLLTEPESVAAVEAARAEYARRRDAVVSHLAAHELAVAAGDGLNLWLPVADEATALIALASAGIGAAPGGPFAVRPGLAPHLRITAGLLSGGRNEIAEVADALVAAAGATWSAPR